MKRLIFILLFGLIPILGFSQQFVETTGTILVGASTDTIGYIMMGTEQPCDVYFNYKDFDDTDAIMNLANIVSIDSNTFDLIDDSDFPYTLDDSTLMVRFVDGFPSPYLGVKVTSNSVTALKALYWTLIIWNP